MCAEAVVEILVAANKLVHLTGDPLPRPARVRVPSGILLLPTPQQGMLGTECVG